MNIRILGPVEVEIEGQPVALGPPKQRALFVILALHNNHVVSVDQFVTALWGDDPPRSAEHAIQTYVSGLRRVFPKGAIVTTPPGYSLSVAPEAVDVIRFERLNEEAAALIGEQRFDEAIRILDDALGLWRGAALGEFTYDEFAQADVRRLEATRVTATERWCEAQIGLGHPEQAVPAATRLAGDEPLSERACELLMRSLYESGRQVDALREFGQFRRRLAEELGLEPTPHLRRLEERILVHEASSTDSHQNPYKGLRAFTEADTGRFFGREDLVASLYRRISRGERFTALVGPSGSGKSSVVNAGLFPLLRREGWNIVSLSPGDEPTGELTRSLAATLPDHPIDGHEDPVEVIRQVGSQRTMIFIDQFEELYTLVADASTRQRFLTHLSAIAAASEPAVSLVIALRADFYDRPLLDPDLANLFTSNVVHVLPFTAVEYEAAAVEPARQVGVDLEPGLIAEIVADVIGQPGALPLFEYALTELFDHVRGNTLTVDAYRLIGGIRGALTRRAEALYAAMDHESREVFQEVCLRLIALTRHTETVRRRVEIDEIADLDVDPAALALVMESLGRHRLLTFGRDPATGVRTIELAHDSLLRNWDRLASWVETGREDIDRRQALVAASIEWEASDRDPDYLLAGNRLERCEEWLEASSLRLTTRERRFVERSVLHRNEQRAEEQAAEARKTRLERRARTRLWTAVAAVVVLVIAVPLAVWLATRPTGPKVALAFEGRDGGGYGGIAVLGWDNAVREFDLNATEEVAFAGAESLLRDLSRSHELVIAVGSIDWPTAVSAVAEDFPKVHYVLIDGVAEQRPNVTSIIFAENEGSYLAGVAAGKASTTGIVGLVEGWQTPMLELFRAGYEAGVRAVDPDARILLTVLAWSAEGFFRPDLGKEAADRQYEEGADVIYNEAGGSGDGIFEAATNRSTPERQLWAIGVDADQYVTASSVVRPHILTSMVKRLDIAVYRSVQSYINGTLDPGILTLGLAESGMELSSSGGFLTPWANTISNATERIVNGAVVVPETPGPADLVELPAPEPTVTAAVIFDGRHCHYQGPMTITHDDVLGLRFDAPPGTWIVIAPLLDDAGDVELAEVPVGEPPSFTDNARLWMIPSGVPGTTLDPEADRYAFYCFTGLEDGDNAIPAALVTVEN